MDGACSTQGEITYSCKIFVRKPEGRFRRTKDNINIYQKGIGCEDIELINLAKDRFQDGLL
jgi:hypothetical protein